MRLFTLLLGTALLVVSASPLSAQRVRIPTSSRESRPSIPPLPNSRVVTANLNPAAYLVDKRRRLGLDETQLETVRAFEAMGPTTEEQAESLARALRRSGPEGVAAAGGSAERSP
jgi:hypothetical protein